LFISPSFAGSVVVSAVDPNVYLAGASGGVYALLAGHIAELLLNWGEMEFAPIRAAVLAVLVSADAGVSIYQRHFIDVTDKAPPLYSSPPP
jgi:rhomboid-related protein 1/2/3